MSSRAKSQWSFHDSCLCLPDSWVLHLTVICHSAYFSVRCHTSQPYIQGLSGTEKLLGWERKIPGACVSGYPTVYGVLGHGTPSCHYYALEAQSLSVTVPLVIQFGFYTWSAILYVFTGWRDPACMEGVAVDFVRSWISWSRGALDFCWGGVGRPLTSSR